MQNLINQKYTKFLWILCLLAIGSFLLTLNLPLVGEEGVYTNAALEMIFTKQYKFATLYGNIYPRPPLYNWLIIVFSKIFNPKNIVLSARMVAVTATTLMAITVFFTAKYLFNTNKQDQTTSLLISSKNTTIQFALFTSAIFLSGDVLFKRGWLAYSDPIFAMFVFASIALLLIGTINNNLLLIFFANVCVFLGFLCKVHTSYVFYIITFFVLLLTKYNKNLLRKNVMFLHILFITPLIFWNIYWQESDCFFTAFSHMKRLAGISNNPEANLLGNIVIFPLQTWLALLPCSLVALFALKNLFKNKYNIQPIIKILLWVTILNFAPYWITSQTNIRYLLPIYPLFSIIIAYIIWQSNLIKQAIILLFISMLLKYVVAIFWYPHQYNIKQGNAELVAKDILLHTNNYPLYINSFSATGLRIAGEINKINWPKKPLQQYPQNNMLYFVIQEDQSMGTQHLRLIKHYKLNKDQIFLYIHE